MPDRYRPELTKEKFDAIIIGSGLGGLTLAALMAKKGKRALVLERHYAAGGFTHTFKRTGGFSWDVGVHYIGRVDDKKAFLRRAFDYITDGKLEWASMGNVYDKAFFGDDEYDFIIGVENQIALFSERFPGEEGAIRKYYQLVKDVNAKVNLFFGDRALSFGWSKYVGWMMRRQFYQYSDKTTYEVISGLTRNKQLISVLCAQFGNYGIPPTRSSFVIHAMVVSHYLYGGNYPVGGSSRIVECIEPVIESAGGKVVIRAEVEEIIVKKNTAIWVKMANGDELFADKIISNAGAWNTYSRLIPQDFKLPFDAANDLERVRPSTANMGLFLGLNGSDEELRLPKHNYWLYDSYDIDGDLAEAIKSPHKDPPMGYVSFPSAKDPAWASENPGKSTVQVISLADYEWFRKWEGDRWMKRGGEYEELKDKLKGFMLTKLLKVAPQIEDKIEVCEVSSPLTTKHFANYQKGEIYGLEHTPERFRVKWLRAQTPVRNLFMTGQDIVTVGIGGALMAGLITGASMMKTNFIKKVVQETS
jgi:all-trans-retinol 13,14-reductase